MKSPSTPTSSNGAALAFERQDLPVSFQPRPMDVIIGRGKQVNKHNDKNGILQDLLQTFAGDYLYGKKERKSELLTIVVQEIRATGCAFIKKESPATATASPSNSVRWYSVDETAARNSAAQFLRNHLSENYKSSKQFKKKLRMDKKKKATRNVSVVSTSSSSDGTPSMTSSSDSSSQSSLASCEQEEMPLIIHNPSSSKSSNCSRYLQQQTDSLVSLLPPHHSSRQSDYDYSFPTTNNTTSTRRVSGTPYSSKLLSGVFDEADDMDAIMNMDLSTQDLFEPRPIGSCQPGTVHGASVFQSMEDEDLFLSWSSSVL